MISQYYNEAYIIEPYPLYIAKQRDRMIRVILYLECPGNKGLRRRKIPAGLDFTAKGPIFKVTSRCN